MVAVRTRYSSARRRERTPKSQCRRYAAFPLNPQSVCVIRIAEPRCGPTSRFASSFSFPSKPQRRFRAAARNSSVLS